MVRMCQCHTQYAYMGTAGAIGSDRGQHETRLPGLADLADLPNVTEAPRSYWLGPSLHRWMPTSLDDVVSAAAAGSLDETHWVELKKAIPATSKEANLELARDLASLGADGGLLVIGVDDDGGRAGDVVGTGDLSRLRDRIDQVARSRVHPPLPVSTTVILDSSDPTGDRGCLLVSVPASPDAPHMADHHYWGRGDTGKRKLGDLEVRRYFAERRLREEQAAARMAAWIRSPSVRPNASSGGRAYAVAAPRGGRLDQLLDLLYRGDGTLPSAIQAAADAVSARARAGFPISMATRYYRGNRHEGYTTDDRENPGSIDERELVVVEMHEDGAVHVLHGQVTTEHSSSGRIIQVSIVGEVVLQTLLLATHLGGQSGYYGQWDVGVHVTHTRGASDSQLAVHGGVKGASWPEDTYEQIATVTSEELMAHPERVAHRLLLPLARVLRVERQLATSLGIVN
jgi:Schlafen, AlbA_2